MAKKVVRYRLERHKWADEVEKAKKQRKIVYVVIGLCVLSLVVGFGVGKLTSRGISTANNKAMQKLQPVRKGKPGGMPTSTAHVATTQQRLYNHQLRTLQAKPLKKIE